MGCAASAPRPPPPSSTLKQREGLTNGKKKLPTTSPHHSNGAGNSTRAEHRERIVFAKGFSQNMHIDKQPRSAQEVASILSILDQCYLFSNLSHEQKEDLCLYMRRLNMRAGDVVRNALMDFYGIESGEYELTNGGGKPREAYFGEMSLMFATGSSNSSGVDAVDAKCLRDGVLWTIDRDTFRQVIASSNEQQREEKRLAVSSIKLLKDSLSGEQLNRLIEAVHLLRFPANHEIVRKGERGEVCYFIKQGSVLCSRIGENQLGQVALGQGSYFGERALLRDEPRAADVHATTDVVVMAIDRKDFDELLGPLRSVMDANMKERVVESLPILKELSPRLRQEVIADFELESFQRGDVIVEQGDSRADKFYVVRAGEVKVMENGVEIAALREGNWFGEMALLGNGVRSATCLAHSATVECFVLRRATFQTLVSGSKILNTTSEYRKSANLKRRSGGGGAALATPPQATATAVPPGRSKLSAQLHELQRHHILGKGTFGTVFLVSYSGQYYALKAMNKHNLVRCEQRTNVMNEKQILAECDSHPFVLQLYQTLQDRDTLYMLLEFVQGGELFSIMQERFRFPLYAAIFYSACIVDVFEHIHALGIVYRDLKPENVLIDKFGYVKLADFGFAKHVTDKTYTLCGTPEYLAPEVVLGSGHDKGVDYWAVGILIFEMLVGISPFADEYDEDQRTVCGNIVRGRVAFDKLNLAIHDTEVNKSEDDGFWTLAPSCIANSATRSSNAAIARSAGATVYYAEAEDVVKRLLNKSPVQRLGNLKDGAKDVKRHAFFNALRTSNEDEDDNEERLRARRVLAPYVPKVSSAHDSSRFDLFEPDQTWPAYKDSQEWCASF